MKNRCPASLKRIPWKHVQRNSGAVKYQCPDCSAVVVGQWQIANLGGWNYPAHDKGV